MKGNARLNKFSENNLEKLKRRFYNFSIIISVIFASFGKRTSNCGESVKIIAKHFGEGVQKYILSTHFSHTAPYTVE